MSSSEPFTVGLIQMTSEFLNVGENAAKAECRIREAAAQGARLICLPEGFLTGYAGNRLREAAELAEESDGPHLVRFSRLARELGVYLLIPFFERGSDGIRNSVIFFDDTGCSVGCYSKTHLISSEKGIFTPGDRFFVWDTPLGRIGSLICYDICFPETCRILSESGAQLILVPSAWGAESYYRDWWDLNVTCRALDHLVYVAAVNQVGSEGETTFAGRSKICSPIGEVIGQCSDDREEILLSKIDLDRIRIERMKNTVLEDARPELYASILNEMRRGQA